MQLIVNEPWTGNQMSYEVVQLIASNEPWTGNQMSYEVVQLIVSNEPWTGNQMWTVWGGATNC